MPEDIASNTVQKKFTKRLDFYWQSISIYGLVLTFYIIGKSFFVPGKIDYWLNDPVVILLSFFNIITAIALLINSYKNYTIISGDGFIVFKSRIGEKKYTSADIKKITVVKEKAIRHKQITHKIIRIYLHNRRWAVKIRPSSYKNSAELINSIKKLKTQ